MLHLALHPLLNALHRLCQRVGVQRLFVFGSAITPRFDPERSDLDVVVEMPAGLDPLDRGERLLTLWNELETLFGRRVDLVTPESVRNPIFRRELTQTQELVYDATHS